MGNVQNLVVGFFGQPKSHQIVRTDDEELNKQSFDSDPTVVAMDADDESTDRK